MQLIKKYRAFLLLIIVLLSFSIRFLWLDQAPRGLLIDEAHFGYIAESLLKTGRDEHGQPWPLVFQGFGDQKLPAQAYLLIPFVKFLGLNALAVRLPSVLIGSLLPLAVYWLLKELRMESALALLGALIVALNPWTFMMSRFAYEANLGLLFFSLGLIGLVRLARNKKPTWSVLLTAFSFAATWYSYIAFRPVTLALSALYLTYLLLVKKVKFKFALLFFAVFTLLIAPLFHPQVATTGTARFEQIGIFSEEGLVLVINENRTFCTERLPKAICYAVWNKPTVFTKELLHRFVEVYSPQFLATTGHPGNRYQTLENYGQFYLALWPLLCLGLVAVLFETEQLQTNNEIRVLLLLGLLIAPWSAILVGDPQKIRLSPLLPFLIVSMILGLKLLWQFFPRRQWRQWLLAGLVSLMFVASGAYLIDFYTVHTHKFDLVYQSYLPDLFAQIESRKTAETRIYLKPFFSDPIMAYAYYQRVGPQHYQEQVILGEEEDSGFQHAVGLDNYLVTDDPMINVGCRAVEGNYPAFYVTNEWFREIPFVQRIASENGAVYYAYIYDAAAQARRHPELCL